MGKKIFLKKEQTVKYQFFTFMINLQKLIVKNSFNSPVFFDTIVK